ncbi:MAG TPA: TonB-dependent receptor [Gemmatimonadaceae bacterium]|nr:TonB-dependent receptor [Gemmatimonadaceae bacterium]
MIQQCRRLGLIALAAIVTSGGLARLDAQGITTATISGVVSGANGEGIEAAQIQVQHRATGATTGTISKEGGRYAVAGLETGGPYTLTIRRIGYQQATRDNVFLTLGQNLEMNIQLVEQAATLAGVTVEAEEDPLFSASKQGTSTHINEQLIQRLPTLNRNFTDFVRATPQVSTTGPGLSGGGVNNRFNNIQIDGASETDLFGLGSTGQPGGQARGKSISLEAVKEYQVLLSPFDLRHGNFNGALINAVTKSGTNQFRGTAFYTMRNEGLARDVPLIRQSTFDQKMFGFSLGGPIVTDKAHFFIAPEFQNQEQPATGPYLGQGADAGVPFLATEANLTRFGQLLEGYGIEPGSANIFNAENPTRNFFGRLDININPVHRFFIRHNYGMAEWDRLTDRNRTTVQMTSNGYFFASRKNATVAQLLSNFNNGTSNELIAGFTTIRDRRTPNSFAPQVSVRTIGTDGSTVTLRAGSEEFSQGNSLDQDIFELTNNYSFPLGARHRLTVGGRAERYTIANLFSRASFGVYEFDNLDSLARGSARTFRIAKNLGGGSNAAEFDAYQFALYVQDQFQYNSRLTITYGIRADMPVLPDEPRYTSAVEGTFGRDTREVPTGKVQWSPRVGFNWDVTGDRVNQIRGGAGVFVGRPAFVWVSNAYANSGSGLVTLLCGVGSSVDSRARQPFSPDPENQPSNCLNGQGLSTGFIGPVNLLTSDLNYPQVLRGSLAYDRRLPWNMVGTLEGMYTRGINNWFYVNRNIAFRGTDKNGRAIYADTITTAGVVRIRPVSTRFQEVIDVENQSKDYSFNITGQLQKQFAQAVEARVSYTYSRARDVQSLTSSQAISNWRFGRTLGGRHDDKNLGISLFDQPHKLQVTATYTAPWKRFPTDVSVLYTGQSGAPYDYIYSGGSGGSGDLNGDGFQGNDLIYIPRDATNPNEIIFRNIGGTTPATAAEQAAAFEEFIESSDCLREQRGRIMERNSCRAPWQNTMDLSIRQSLPAVGGNRLAVQLDIFNFLNLINKDWGKIQVTANSLNSNVPLLQHVGQTGTNGAAGGANIPLTQSQGIFQFPLSTREYTSDNFSSYYQIQLTARYSLF